MKFLFEMKVLGYSLVTQSAMGITQKALYCKKITK